ncbi:MAG: hypothetical protein ACRD3G_14955 [Vicinamibacterales bacterium]
MCRGNAGRGDTLRVTELLGLGSQERSEAEFHNLLASADLDIIRVGAVTLAFSLIEAAPIDS